MFSFRVFHNGIPSKILNPQRDCRQEDSIPLFLFIHSPENFKENKGIKIDGKKCNLKTIRWSLISDGSASSLVGILQT